MKQTEKFFEDYILAAMTHNKATSEGDYKTVNKQYVKLTRFYKKLEKDPSFAESFLEKLLRDTNAAVRIWAAAHALGLRVIVDDALCVLQEMSKDQNIGILRLDAEVVLKEWEKKGWLKFFPPT